MPSGTSHRFVMRLVGIGGRPFIDLSFLLEGVDLEAIDDEVCFGLTRVEPWYTGGSLKWMGVVAPSVAEDPYADYGHVIAAFSREERERFVSLAEDPSVFDPARLDEYVFGDETDHPLSKAQMVYLKLKYGVYFPWKVVFHLVENQRWDDKHSGSGKGFVPDALEHFPRTVELIRSLPFREIGRCVLFGLEANDHAPLHRDSEPGRAESVAQSISICPRGNKRFFLTDPAEREKTYVGSRAYWFNDADYHGVEPDPFFRYSIRVDGVFEPSFLRRIAAPAARRERVR